MEVATIGMAHAWHGERIVQSGQLLTSERSDELVALRRRTLSLRDGIVQHGVGRPGRAAAHLDRSAKYPVGEGEEREGRKTHNKHFCTNKHNVFFCLHRVLPGTVPMGCDFNAQTQRGFVGPDSAK